MVPRLYIDENLRGLARWLRFLGFDAKLADGGRPDDEILAEARAEGRVLLTRDRRLAESGGRLVGEPRTRDQLAEVLRGLDRPPREDWFSRCVLCNRRLREITPAERGSAPPEFSRYWRCDGCGRTYWQGSHFERTRRYLESLS